MKRQPLCTVGGKYIGVAVMENDTQFLQKDKNRTTI